MASADLNGLIDRWRGGDQAAAEELFQRYAARLIALVRHFLAEKYLRRVDAEDVVQSALRSFFVGTREGRYLLDHCGELWRLLAAITLHKMRHQIARHQAAKRSVNREECGGLDEQWLVRFQDRLATPPGTGDAAALAEEIGRIRDSLPPHEQRMLELRLEGYTLDEIALDAGRSQRTVRRVMERVRADILERQQELIA